MGAKMNVWDRCSELLLEILQIEILRIRSFAYAGNSLIAASIADHIHNIPEILRSGRLDLVRSYLDADVPSYVLSQGNVSMLSELWGELRHLLKCTDTETL